MTATAPAGSLPTEPPNTTLLHLTQILVSYEDAVRLLRIRDTYDWHQKVWEAFGGRDGDPRDFLTRVDRLEENYRLLIVSATQPDKPDWCPKRNAEGISLLILTSEPNCQGFKIERWGEPARRDAELSGLWLVAEQWVDAENQPF